MQFSSYYGAVNRLLALQNIEVPWKHNDRVSLEASCTRLRQLLGRLGNPEASMRYIHVTGTSGKSSVTHLIHEMLLADNRKVASYISPHTTTFLERFRVNDRLVAPDDLVDAVDDVLSAYQSHVSAGLSPLSFFELSTCIAFVAFANAHVEWCVLEVGLGGRWDSTNIIPHKDVAVVTNVDLDHTDVLGTTCKAIAKEKAGIIVPGCEVVTGTTRADARKVILDAAREMYTPVTLVRMPSNKDHNLHNALIAAAAAQVVGVPMDAVERALKIHKGLPCRFEIVQENPHVIIDGAHNPAKMATTVRELGKKATVIFGCKETKDAKAMLRELIKIARIVYTTRYDHGRGNPANPATLLAIVPKKLRGQAFLFAHDARAYALARAKPTDTILITGSLYLAGEMRTHWTSEEKILRNRDSGVQKT